jgi:putative ABC transport system substrate-binding protein
MMDRRTFIGAFAGCVVIAHSDAKAQPAAKVQRVGFLSYTTPEQSAPLLGEFTKGMREIGYVDGRNVVIEPHYGDGTQSRLQDLAIGVVRSRVDVIVTGSNPIAAAAKQATTTIPIVMVGALDPVGFGLVADLARPGANVTGLTVDAGAEMSGKLLGLLTEIVPGLSRVGVLRQFGFDSPQQAVAAQRLNVELYPVDVRTIDELEGAFAAMVRNRVGAFVIRGSLFYVRRQRVADLALKHRLPAIHGLREYAEAGLLMTYGANLPDLYRRAASYVDRIIKGAKPSDLPVEQPAKVDLVINLRTAKSLGLTVPQSLLLRADEVIR